MRFDKCSHFLIENILPPPKVPLCPCAVCVPRTGCWAVVNDYSCLLLEFHVNANPLMCVLFCNCSTILGQSVLFPLCTRVLEVCVCVCVCVSQYGLMNSYFVLWVLIQYCHFAAHIVPPLAIGSSFRLALMFFSHVPNLFQALLYFVTFPGIPGLSYIFLALESITS